MRKRRFAGVSSACRNWSLMPSADSLRGSGPALRREEKESDEKSSNGPHMACLVPVVPLRLDDRFVARNLLGRERGSGATLASWRNTSQWNMTVAGIKALFGPGHLQPSTPKPSAGSSPRPTRPRRNRAVVAQREPALSQRRTKNVTHKALETCSIALAHRHRRVQTAPDPKQSDVVHDGRAPGGCGSKQIVASTAPPPPSNTNYHDSVPRPGARAPDSSATGAPHSHRRRPRISEDVALRPAYQWSTRARHAQPQVLG